MIQYNGVYQNQPKLIGNHVNISGMKAFRVQNNISKGPHWLTFVSAGYPKKGILQDKHILNWYILFLFQIDQYSVW